MGKRKYKMGMRDGISALSKIEYRNLKKDLEYLGFQLLHLVLHLYDNKSENLFKYAYEINRSLISPSNKMVSPLLVYC